MIKTFLKKVLTSFGFEIQRNYPDSQSLIRFYKKWKGIPWSSKYYLAKFGQIQNTLSRPETLSLFQANKLLPAKFGYGFDERCVEYPWLVSNLPSGVENLLDAGSAINFSFLLETLRQKIQNIHIMTLAPENHCFWKQGISYIYGDLRQIPIKDNHYDVITCISTLEHIGLDNINFINNTKYQESKDQDFCIALHEIRRVLKLGGTLLLTVPFGKYCNYGTFQQFDLDLLNQAIEAFGPAQITEIFYRYTEQGWQIATAQECSESEYVDWVANHNQLLGRNIPVEPDLAAAARAVACVKFIKQ